MSTAPRPITAEYFEAATGSAPTQDDLERCNCDKVGQGGHHFCGWNDESNLPVFMYYIAAKESK